MSCFQKNKNAPDIEDAAFVATLLTPPLHSSTQLNSNDKKNLTAAYSEISQKFLNHSFQTDEDIEKYMKQMSRKYKISLSKRHLFNIYQQLNIDDPVLKPLIIKKNVRSHSGVVVITVFTSAHPEYTDKNGVRQIQPFSCKWDCHFCPNEKANERNGFIDQPRSYLYTEPGVLRANHCNFDCVEQMTSRMTTLMMNGHIIDKLEILVLGGTWCSYPEEYQNEFIRDIYFSANTFVSKYNTNTQSPTPFIRNRKTLSEEIKINETADVHIIGLTLETRPDTINLTEIQKFRDFGCTRVQLGVQHTCDKILKKINRGHTIEQSLKAIKLLKDNCFKVDIHIMPNLPGASVLEDYIMFQLFLKHPAYQADQWKIYPCAVTPYTKIEKWYNEGKYVPYEESDLFQLIKSVKIKVPEYIRLNRIIRDISSEDVLGGYSQKSTNMRQYLQEDMIKNKWCCNCIRCREVKNDTFESANLKVEKYAASDGIEYFISLNTEKNKLIGFLRLRFPSHVLFKTAPIHTVQLDILKDSALIRELHVYSSVKKVKDSTSHYAQHKGYGKQLLKVAEQIVAKHNVRKIAIISGVGVRDYYRKQGYSLVDTYMIKDLSFWNSIIRPKYILNRKQLQNKHSPLSIIFLTIVIGVAITIIYKKRH
jgi:ELP3 family radical SAM enzyme/protein acetyltransferase